MIDYVAILTRKYEGAIWTLNGDSYQGLTWLSDTAKPTKAALDAMWPEVQQLIQDEINAKIAKKEAVLSKLGITADELAAALS